MSLKIHAILNIEGDIRLLPIWLDYHKHIFDSGIVIFGDENILEIKHIVSRFFQGWSFHRTYPISSSQYSENETTGECVCSIFLSSNEFLLSSNKLEIVEFFKFNTPIKFNARIKSRGVPNNVVDFVSNLSLSNENNSSSVEVKLLSTYADTLTSDQISVLVRQQRKELEKTDYIYYLDAYAYSNYDWGEDRVILREDTNLLETTDFNGDGHCIFPMNSYNVFLQRLIEAKIEEVTSRHIDAETYHLHINDEEHTKIINAMPWKKTESPEIQEFAEYMESRVSEIVGRRVKIFNDDIWIRICRPSSVTETDYNPCHRDIYLDFYRNIVNIYVPIVGSNEKSSLAMQSGSHLWNERDLVVTKGGAYFKNVGKKYSVDAILRSKQPLNMVRPNPGIDEFILFSPYLIHGCSSNDNVDTTRLSVEIRFIADDENAKIQEDAFNMFLKERVWR